MWLSIRSILPRASNYIFKSRQCVRRISSIFPDSSPKPQFKVDPVPELVKEISSKKMSEFLVPNNSPIVSLDCNEAFAGLSDREKLYAHYMSKASWCGGLIVLVQTSVESPLIYVLLSKVFRSQSLEELKKVALTQCDFTEDEFTAFLMYAGSFFCNMGNYKSFGDTKFVPDLTKEKFVKLVQQSKAGELNPEHIKNLLNQTVDRIFSLDDGVKRLGFHENATTTYFSKNFTAADVEIVKNFMIEKNISPYNNRSFKTIDEGGCSHYEIRLSSVLRTEDLDKSEQVGQHSVNGHKFVVTRGDFRELLDLVNKNLVQAKDQSANPNQLNMIEKYVESFHSGSLDAHKDGSRFWVKDFNPVVETYIGFIETYRDPSGIRGEFEGFVAMVNKPMSKKFTQLVEEAETFLPMLPWPSAFEKDKFLRPDFTTIDILTFGGSGVPSGINIPNYDEIKQSEGFKNVSLGNVIAACCKARTPNYLGTADKELLTKYDVPAFEVQVGLHELLGHGSGKMFIRTPDGKFNFDIENVKDLETGKKITTWYEEGSTYDSIFTSIGSAFEECRAECVGLYLCVVPEVMKIFGFSGLEAEDVIYANWLSETHSGLESLQMYDPKTKRWLQAHCQARFGILRVMIEAGEGLITIKEVSGEDGKPDLSFSLDRTKIRSVGIPALGKFLQKIQLYRSIAALERATVMFDKYTAVTSEDAYPFLNYREIIMARKKPRRMIVQSNTFVENEKVVLKSYASSPDGLIESWVDRFDNHEELEKILEELWHREQPHF